MVHFGCTDPTPATECLVFVLESRIQMSGTGANYRHVLIALGTFSALFGALYISSTLEHFLDF